MPIGGTITARAGGAAAASAWTVEYEVDFSAEAAHDFTVTPTGTIQGIDWTAENTAGAGTLGLDGSTGLQVFASGGSGPWYGGTNASPLVSASLSDIVAGLAQDDTVCLQLEMSSSADVSRNYHSYGLGLWDGTLGDATGFALSRRVYDNGTKDGFIVNTSQDLVTVATQSDLFEIVWVPADGQVLSVGQLGGADFPDPLTTTARRSYNSMHGQGPGGSLTWRIPYADARVAIFCYAQNGGSGLDATATRLRVLRRNA